MNHGKLFIVCTVLALFGAGCLSSSDGGGGASSGPLDGSFAISALTCNGSSTPFLPTGAVAEFLVLANATGSFITSFSSGCVATEGNVYTYPSSTSFTMQTVNRVCSGTSCSGSECTANSTAGTAMTMNYSLSGTTLTLTRTSDGNDGCSNGQATVYTAAKQ